MRIERRDMIDGPLSWLLFVTMWALPAVGAAIHWYALALAFTFLAPLTTLLLYLGAREMAQRRAARADEREKLATVRPGGMEPNWPNWGQGGPQMNNRASLVADGHTGKGESNE